MIAKVFVEDWQLQCCGDPFSVGTAVDWTVTEPDREWLDSVLGENAAAITHSEEHHGSEKGRVSGVVRAIAAAYHRLTPATDGSKLLEPVPGTTVLRPVTTANGYEPAIDGLSFRGYIVELG